MGLLENIVNYKQSFVEQSKKNLPLERLKAMAKAGDFALTKALSNDKTNIIAEIKRGSPSAGIIFEMFEPVKIAKSYFKAGAGAISVITDEKYFFGNLGMLNDVSSAVSLPVLRKDFIIDEYQIYEASANGASAVLLIANILSADMLKKLKNTADSLGLDSLIEVHSEEELKTVFNVLPCIIGINNRNLDTLEIDLEVSEKLARLAPKGRILISESGIRSAGDIKRLKNCGINNFLVGENILKSSDMEQKIKELVNA